MRKILKKVWLIFEHYYFVFRYGYDNNYSDVGFFIKNNPISLKYTYANWGSRLWEIFLIKKWLNEINIKDKNVVDIGIGLPSDSNFYEFYIESGCYLDAYDLDDRLKKDIVLSERCKIYYKSSDIMNEVMDDSVDVVVALSSLEHYPIESFYKTIKEVHRILKPSGFFLVTLDITFNKNRSAPWAILEKTYNNLPEIENNSGLRDVDKQITAENFLDMISLYFRTADNKLKDKNHFSLKQLVYSDKWNSHVAYLRLIKK